MSVGESSKYFVLIHEPGCVPQRKIPHPQTMVGAVAFVAECLECRSPWTDYTICEVTPELDLHTESGFTAIDIYGNRKQRAILKTLRKDKANAYQMGRQILAAAGDQRPAIRREIKP